MNRRYDKAFAVWLMGTVIMAASFVGTFAYALTPKERAIVQHAAKGVDDAIVHNDVAKAETAAANAATSNAEASAKVADDKSVVAEKQAKDLREELKRSATENAKMRPIVDEVQSWCGIGGIIYGFKRLAVHILILIGVLLVIGIALAIFAPGVITAIRLGLNGTLGFLGLIEAVMKPLWSRLWSDLTGLFQRKAPNDKKKSSRKR